MAASPPALNRRPRPARRDPRRGSEDPLLATRALVVTDLVDSTRLAEALGDTAAAALGARHDRVARDLLARHGGREIDKTDGFLLLFEADPVGYAVAYHEALTALGLRARAGLHVGEVILRENPAADVARGAKPLEVEGVAKSIAGRVMSLAGGGQTLATAAAVEAFGVPREGPSGATVAVSHGWWQLKGVTRPIEIFEIGVASATPFAPPPDSAKAWRVVRQGDIWVPAREIPRSLPAERDSFVGRDQDLITLGRRLDEGARLVTVLGMGGSGKTRLVSRFAWTRLGDFPGGAWFCDLSEARSADGITQAVARALEVPLGREEPVTLLGHAIAGRGKCLILLDNFEQVARWVEETLGRWLDRTEEARFVVTTREVLGLPGETTLALAPMPAEESVQLFASRAAQARQDYALTEAERPDVEALVRLLDGLPLAIELAAARVRVMPPRTLLQRMSERFRLLTSSGGRHTRQATLRATFDWSWDLLSPDERAALAQLSVFEGGFTLDAAEAVLTLAELWPADAVQALVDRSWVRPTADGRFDLLVSVQEYASEKLDSLGGRAEAEARHGAWFARFGAPEALDALDREGGTGRRLLLGQELDNLATAGRRAVLRGAPAEATRHLEAVWAVVAFRGPVQLAAELADDILGLALDPSLRARVRVTRGLALHVLGRSDEARADYEEGRAGLGPDAGSTAAIAFRGLAILHREMGHPEAAQQAYEAALAQSRAAGDVRGEGADIGNLGILHLEQGRPNDALTHFEAALAIARRVGDRRLEGVLLGNLANVHLAEGRVEAARDHYEAGRMVAREIGNRRGEAVILGNLGTLCKQMGLLEEARTHLEAALTAHRQVGNRRFEAVVLTILGVVERNLGRREVARAHLEASLRLHREVHNPRMQAEALAHLGETCLQEGRLVEADAHLARALEIARSVPDRQGEGFAHGIVAQVALGLGELDRARAHAEAGATLLRAIHQAIELGRVQAVYATILAAVGDSVGARAALAEAEALAKETGALPTSSLGRALAGARARVEGPGA